MGEYNITFARSARKEIERLDSAVVSTIFPKIEKLANNPRPRGVRKLQGEQELWRIRIGDYRVIYGVDDRTKQVDIIAVRHRSEAYR